MAQQVQQPMQQNPQQTGQPGAPGMQPGTQMQGPKKSIFKKWWFWLIIALIVIGLGVLVFFLIF